MTNDPPLIERILVVCPANLTFQWQRELREKFDHKFLVLKGSDLRSQFGVNQWMEQNQVVTSLDLAKRDDILPGLRQVRWDLHAAQGMVRKPPPAITSEEDMDEMSRGPPADPPRRLTPPPLPPQGAMTCEPNYPLDWNG